MKESNSMGENKKYNGISNNEICRMNKLRKSYRRNIPLVKNKEYK